MMQHDLPGPGQLVVDVPLVIRELVFQPGIIDIIIGQAAGDIRTHGLHVAGHQLHGSEPAAGDAVDKIPLGRECRSLSPQTQPGRIYQVGHFRGTGGGHIHHPRIGEHPLKQDTRKGHGRRRLLLPALAGCRGIGHIVGFVKGDHTVKIPAEPFGDLVDPGLKVFQGVGFVHPDLGGIAPQGGIRGEQNPVGRRNAVAQLDLV